MKLPKHIIQTFHNKQVYDDDTHASFTEQNTNNIVNAAPVDDQIQAELESEGNKDVTTAEENRKKRRVRKNKMTKERMQHKKMQRRREKKQRN